jgi:hypothetical protein
MWYSLFSINFFLSTSVAFFLSFLGYNEDTFFIFINSKSIRTFFFFSLVSAFTWLSKASYCFLWRNNASIHFL